MLRCRLRPGAYLAPLADAPLGTRLVVARLRHQPLVLAALPVHQPPAQVVHAVRLSAAGAAATRLGALQADDGSFDLLWISSRYLDSFKTDFYIIVLYPCTASLSHIKDEISQWLDH